MKHGNHMKFKMNQGFTSTELMVVIAIVGIITMVGVPKYQAYKAKAVVSEGTTTLDSMWTAQQAFHLANDRYSTVGDPGADASWQTAFLSNNELGIIVPRNAKYDYGNWMLEDPNLLGFANLKNFWTTKIASCSIHWGDQRVVYVSKQQTGRNRWPDGFHDGLEGCW
jgi:prepilin-type N-terminal cleavage/methylation domain-containing protein